MGVSIKGLLLSILFFGSASVGDAKAITAIAHTDKGYVRGLRDSGLDVFLGIPYAQPPLEALRWKPPVPTSRWSGIRPAGSFSAACYQGRGEPFGPFTREFIIAGRRSEDCLYLNVWAPVDRTKPKPVLVFIHGGGFGSGATEIPIYNGAGLARKDVVVVTINYRLGVFGFLAHPELTAESAIGSSGNYGILDMIAALRWVRANIAQFGGDAHNVTISGQSAGAAAVSDLLVSPQAKGLFQRAVIESGPGLGVPMPSLAVAEKSGLDVARLLGVQTVKQLRGIAPDALLAATRAASPSPGKTSMPRIAMAPNIDGKVIAWDPEEADGRTLSDVPILAGYNHDEAFIFGTPTATPKQFEDYVHDKYGEFADRFLAVYPHTTTEEASKSMDAIGRDRYMAQLVLWTEKRVKAQKSDVFLYRFDHAYPSADVRKFGAFHTAEVPYILGAMDVPGVKFTAQDRRVSDEIQAYFVAFLMTGDPNVASPARVSPTSDRPVPWLDWSQSPGRVLRLGDQVEAIWSISSKERSDVFVNYVAAGGHLSLF